MLAGRYLAFIPTLFGLTVNGAISGIAYFPLLTPENVMLMPLIIYGLFEEGAFVIIATITLCWRASLDEDSERSWRFTAAHVPFAAAMLLTGAVLESTLCS
ncbi:MAG: hypothetical protein OXJ90_11630 [Spirochaetaceae bacterium]|nr:hypothetical protein [Spirochaetaceae bacterium]